MIKNNPQLTNYRLGLDLGTNSIGFAILELDQENSPKKILDSGVRIFSDEQKILTRGEICSQATKHRA